MIEHKHYTGSAAMAVTVESPSPELQYKFDGFDLTVGVAATTAEDLTITKDAVAGTAYDTVIDTIAMAGETDIPRQPIRPIPLEYGDKLKFAWTNTDARTWGLDVKIEREVK